MKHRLTAAAELDLVEAAEFYESQRRGLGIEFAVEVGLAIGAVLDAPRRWPEIESGFHKYRLHRFPYALIYRVMRADSVEICAVFDLRRRPGSWRHGAK